MSLVDNINVPPESAELWNKACVVRSGFFGTKVDRKDVVWRKRNFPSLIARSSVSGLAALWNALTSAEQSAWDDAGYWAQKSGWDLFAQDTIYRLDHNIPGVATPNLYHQYKLGEIKMTGAGQEVRLTQFYGGDFNSNVAWAMNVLCALSSAGAGSYAKWIVKVKTGYWLDDINGPEVITYEYDLTEFTSWDYISDSYLDGFIAGNNVSFEIHIYNMTGSLYIDGMEFDHDDQNFAVDWQCDNIEISWLRNIVSGGSVVQSIYPPDTI